MSVMRPNRFNPMFEELPNPYQIVPQEEGEENLNQGDDIIHLHLDQPWERKLTQTCTWISLGICWYQDLVESL